MDGDCRCPYISKLSNLVEREREKNLKSRINGVNRCYQVLDANWIARESMFKQKQVILKLSDTCLSCKIGKYQQSSKFWGEGCCVLGSCIKQCICTRPYEIYHFIIYLKIIDSRS